MRNIEVLNRILEIEKDRYKSSGDYSVTSLLEPVRIVQLSKRHKDEITLQPEAVVSSLMGTGLHLLIEKYLTEWAKKHKEESSDQILEYELKHSFNILDKSVSLSGRFDIFIDGHMYDIKSTKSWELIFNPGMEKWIAQQNMYRYLASLDHNIPEIKSINIIAFYKDWQKNKALRDRSYPQKQVVQYKLPMWSDEKVKDFIMRKLLDNVMYEDTPDKELPLCTKDERWERFPDGEYFQFAIMKKPSAARAAKIVKTSMADAMKAAKSMKGITSESFVEVRYATRKRCEEWCHVNKFCLAYKEYMKLKKNDKLNDIFPIM